MPTLYYSPGACSLAAHIALEEIGASFEAKRVMIAEGEHRRSEYLAINPRGRVPALVTESFVLTETQAILSYLGYRHPEAGLLPLDDPRRLARTFELLSFFSSSVHIAFAQLWRPERFTDDAAARETVQAKGRAMIDSYFDEIEELASQAEWATGDSFTLADPYLLVFYRWGGRVGIDMRGYSAWTAHKDRMLARPAVQRALAAEGIEIE